MLSVNVPELKELGKLIYDRKEVPGTVLTIVGESGIGKTESVLQFVNDLDGYEEPRVMNVAHLNLEDMGMPVSNGDDFTHFKFAETFKVEGDKNVLIVLDELNRPNNDSVINFLMGAVCERRLFGKKLSDKIRFMATMNPNTDKYIETQDIFGDIASRRRFNLVELRFDKDTFFDYSRSVGLNPDLLDFLIQNNDQVLVSGEINCPRQWHRFDSDVLQQREWGKEDAQELKIASSLYMDSATCALWLKAWEGSLEKFVSPEEILNEFDNKAGPRLTDHIQNKRMDMIEASCNALTPYVQAMPSITPDQIKSLNSFLKLIPRPSAYVTLEKLVPPSNPSLTEPEYPVVTDIVRGLYEDDEMVDLIVAGVEQEEQQSN